MVSSVYFAASLFSARDTLFNAQIATRLESGRFGRPLRVFLPQRDGFEFSSLGQVLGTRLPLAQVPAAVETIIYTLDMGGFLSRSDAVLAVLDEPLDEGVLIEISYARRLGIPVVGLRTDRRTPFGKSGDPLGGIHFFAAYQCTRFITANLTETAEDLDALAQVVIDALVSDEPRQGAGDPVLQSAAQQLFRNVDILAGDLKRDDVLTRIVDNYVTRLDLFQRLAPQTSQQSSSSSLSAVEVLGSSETLSREFTTR